VRSERDEGTTRNDCCHPQSSDKRYHIVRMLARSISAMGSITCSGSASMPAGNMTIGISAALASQPLGSVGGLRGGRMVQVHQLQN
jgi:hypothetical protein